VRWYFHTRCLEHPDRCEVITRLIRLIRRQIVTLNPLRVDQMVLRVLIELLPQLKILHGFTLAGFPTIEEPRVDPTIQPVTHIPTVTHDQDIARTRQPSHRHENSHQLLIVI